jgi:hypothetical protein
MGFRVDAAFPSSKSQTTKEVGELTVDRTASWQVGGWRAAGRWATGGLRDGGEPTSGVSRRAGRDEEAFADGRENVVAKWLG